MIQLPSGGISRSARQSTGGCSCQASDGGNNRRGGGTVVGQKAPDPRITRRQPQPRIELDRCTVHLVERDAGGVSHWSIEPHGMGQRPEPRTPAATRDPRIIRSRASKHLSSTWTILGSTWYWKTRSSLSTSEESTLAYAIGYVYDWARYAGSSGYPFTWPTSTTSNCSSCPEDCDCGDCNGKKWGGYNSGLPLDLLKQTFENGKLHFRKGKEKYCDSEKRAYTRCGDVGDAPDKEVTVGLCASFFSSSITKQEQAVTIVHEIMHALGADERAAYAMALPGYDKVVYCDECRPA